MPQKILPNANDEDGQWENIKSFSEDALANFCARESVTLYRRIYTVVNKKGNEDEEREFTCRECPPIVIHAKRPFGNRKFRVRRKGNHYHGCSTQKMKRAKPRTDKKIGISKQSKRVIAKGKAAPAPRVPIMTYDKDNIMVTRSKVRDGVKIVRHQKWCDCCAPYGESAAVLKKNYSTGDNVIIPKERPSKSTKHAVNPSRNYIVTTPESDDDEVDEPCSSSSIENRSDQPGCSYTYNEPVNGNMGVGCSNGSLLENMMTDHQLLHEHLHSDPQPQQQLATAAHPQSFELLQFQNLPNFHERNGLLTQLAEKFGLKMNAILDEGSATEDYFVMQQQRSGERIAANGMQPKLIIKFFSPNNSLFVANIEYRFGVRGTPSGRCIWYALDFNYFLWAIQGLCYETFFPSKGVIDQENNAYGPFVEEPLEEGQGHQNSTNFSIMDQHRELRLDQVVAEMLLSVQRTDGNTKLFVGRPNMTHRSIRLLFTEAEHHVDVTELRGCRGKRNEERWPKFNRTMFRYALIGKAMNTFYPNEI